MPVRLPQTLGVRGVTVTVRLPRPLLERLNADAQALGVSRGRLIVDMLTARTARAQRRTPAPLATKGSS